MQQITGQIARNEPLLPVKLKDSSTQDPIVLVDAPGVLQQRVMTLQEQETPPALSTAKPVVVTETPTPTRYYAVLYHSKGRMVSTPPMTLNAEFFDNGSGSGTSRLIFPGNQFWEGEFRLLSYEDSFKATAKPLLLDPDKVVPSKTSAKKGFAAYPHPNGTLMECSFSMSIAGRIDQGRCLDNRGNEYLIAY